MWERKGQILFKIGAGVAENSKSMHSTFRDVTLIGIRSLLQTLILHDLIFFLGDK